MFTSDMNVSWRELFYTKFNEIEGERWKQFFFLILNLVFSPGSADLNVPENFVSFSSTDSCLYMHLFKDQNAVACAVASESSLPPNRAYSCIILESISLHFQIIAISSFSISAIFTVFFFSFYWCYLFLFYDFSFVIFYHLNFFKCLIFFIYLSHCNIFLHLSY